MNYKITTALLAVVVVALLAKDYFKAEPDAPVATTSLQDPCRPTFEVNSILPYKGKIDTLGKFITNKEAFDMLEGYHAYQSSTVNEHDRTKSLYGFVFGIEKINTLMENIKIHNKNNKDSLRDVIGLRVYFSRNIHHIYSNKDYNDVFMIPIVRDSTKNFHKIDSEIDKNFKNDNMILNGALPCPVDCYPYQ
jgi:hypothetical protein